MKGYIYFRYRDKDGKRHNHRAVLEEDELVFAIRDSSDVAQSLKEMILPNPRVRILKSELKGEDGDLIHLLVNDWTHNEYRFLEIETEILGKKGKIRIERKKHGNAILDITIDASETSKDNGDQALQDELLPFIGSKSVLNNVEGGEFYAAYNSMLLEDGRPISHQALRAKFPEKQADKVFGEYGHLTFEQARNVKYWRSTMSEEENLAFTSAKNRREWLNDHIKRQ